MYEVVLTCRTAFSEDRQDDNCGNLIKTTSFWYVRAHVQKGCSFKHSHNCPLSADVITCWWYKDVVWKLDERKLDVIQTWKEELDSIWELAHIHCMLKTPALILVITS